LPLTYLQKRNPNAIVAVFPSDQFVLEADRLMRHIRLAHAVVQRHPSNLVLLGVEPSYEESDYGYIVSCTHRDISGWGVKKVEAFVEKPDVLEAHELIRRGALWNTMVMVFNAGTLFRWVKEIAPDIFRHFARIYDAIGTSAEASTVCSEYAHMRTMNFSKDLLEPLAKQTGRLTVLPVTNLTWSDWGSESRILSSLASIGKLPCFQKGVTATQESNRVRVKRARGSDRPATYTVQ
jgi:mannose-1-phosphate guanylyltransferase